MSTLSARRRPSPTPRSNVVDPAAGSVFVVWCTMADGDGYYVGHWDGGSDPDAAEEMPRCRTLQRALDWATARSANVLVSPSWGTDRCLSAGSRTRRGERHLLRY
jgi:hypothetical protein